MASLRELGNKWIWGKTNLKQESKVIRSLRDDSGLGFTNVDTTNVDPVLLRNILLREPLIRKAIYKKNRDTFKNWFEIRPLKEDDKVDQRDIDILTDFDKKTNFSNILFISGVCANTYGTGFIEKIYTEHGNSKADSKPSPTSKLTGLEVLNSEKIKTREKSGKGDLLYPVYQGGIEDKILIHPDRLEVVRIDKLPHSYFGISVIAVALNILQSKMTADKSSGDFVDWAGRGIYDLTITGMQDEQENAAKKILKQHPSYLVHDEDYALDVKSPQRIDLKSFYDYFFVNIAASIEIPTHILTGTDSANVTGSEVGVSAYYSDIQNIQKLVFTPIIEKIYTEVLAAQGRKWKYSIYWNPMFVDELAEAKILQTRAYSATQAVASKIISISEGRKILNEGVIKLDPDEIPEFDEISTPSVSPIQPVIEPQPVIKKESIIEFVPFLTQVQKDMIQKEKELGEKELVEQENRLKEAKKLKRKRKTK